MKKIALLIIALIYVAGANAQQVLLKTEYGNMKIKLYDQTPQHRNNFLKLVKEGYYDNLLFHRVIKNFMIQGGDPQSKEAAQGENLGSGGPGYRIPAEFNSNFFHKKGAVAAARTGDNVNPKKESSGSQFYIVQGKVYSNEELQTLEKGMCLQQNMTAIRKCISEDKQLGNKVDSVSRSNPAVIEDYVYENVYIKLKEEGANLREFRFSDEQREAYTTIGGTPFLDGNYTVFGEVVEGLDVIDKIAAQQTNKSDRPKTDIKMTMEWIEN